jgi:NAD(P)-dependent dehydrogenase (short-subunit alcohol dehydrogenase family)
VSSATYSDLIDRAVLVTGGASGIGADIVQGFAAQGARVGFLDIQDEAASALVLELAGGRHAPVYRHCDLTDLAALKTAIEDLARVTGPFGILINNAANDQRHQFQDVTEAMWEDLMAINLRPQLFAGQAVAPMMAGQRGGAIVNISSVAWRYGSDQMPVYGAAKAGVVGLTKAMARSLGRQNIRVNAIEPGAVMTERQRKLWYPTQESVDAMTARQVLQMPLLGSDIADMALFLASDAARMITKQVFVVDAGMS